MSNVPLVESFMTSKVVTLDPTLDIYEGILKMMKFDVSGSPVVEEDGFPFHPLILANFLLKMFMPMGEMDSKQVTRERFI